MYGGGEFDGNVAFAGGGCTPSQATTQAHNSSSSFKNNTLLPLALKQLNSVSTNVESNFSIDGVDINTQREYLNALEKELGEKEESMLRSLKSRAMDGMTFDEMTIPDRSTALKNLPPRFHGAYNKLAVNKVNTFLEPWVWEEAKRSNRVGNFYLSDDGSFSHLFWHIQELVVSHRKQWRKLDGPVRDQHGHRICYAYVASDLVSIKRVIRGWDDAYVPLCPWFLSYFVPSDDPTVKRGHRCNTNSLEDVLQFIQREGIPKEIPKHKVFDCNNRPPSADQPRFKIKSVMSIETFEEALEEIKTQPIGASLIVFTGLFLPGKRIYYGPKKKGAQFLAFHAVLMMGVEEMDGELVVKCKFSNGKGAVDGGYAYVSASLVYMVIAADPKEEDRHRATPRPQHLLSNFYYAEMDQAPPNPKRKHQQKNQDRGGSSKKPRV